MSPEMATEIATARINVDLVMWTPDGLYRVRVAPYTYPGDFVEFTQWSAENGPEAWRATLYRTYQPINSFDGTRAQVIAQAGRWTH